MISDRTVVVGDGRVVNGDDGSICVETVGSARFRHDKVS